ncbi:MAG: glycine cleavage system protein GcvH [Deltaproteobacteria bacterium]|nr:glycine cleavage system protein GcvH [Deltaproteobacteria bacterium]
MTIPEEFKYTKEHEWLCSEQDHFVVGITAHAQEQLGDVVFVELPEVGSRVKQGESFGSVESVKAVNDLYAPVSGEVIEINEQLADNAALVNEDPYGKGWLIKVKRTDDHNEDGNLLSAADYKKLLDG